MFIIWGKGGGDSWDETFHYLNLDKFKSSNNLVIRMTTLNFKELQLTYRTNASFSSVISFPALYVLTEIRSVETYRFKLQPYQTFSLLQCTQR